MPLLAPTRSTLITLRRTGPDMLVADAAGRFAGTIEIHGTHHFVRDGFGQYIGDYTNVDSAHQRLTDHHSSSR